MSLTEVRRGRVVFALSHFGDMKVCRDFFTVAFLNSSGEVELCQHGKYEHLSCRSQ